MKPEYRRSAPTGRRNLRPVLNAGQQWHIRMFRHGLRNQVRRMKPRSWTTEFWFRSDLFKRGEASRRAALKRLIAG